MRDFRTSIGTIDDEAIVEAIEEVKRKGFTLKALERACRLGAKEAFQYATSQHCPDSATERTAIAATVLDYLTKGLQQVREEQEKQRQEEVQKSRSTYGYGDVYKVGEQKISYCDLCDQPTTQEEAIRRKKEGKYPNVYFPAVTIEKSGDFGHAECFIAKGIIKTPKALKELQCLLVPAPDPTIRKPDEGNKVTCSKCQHEYEPDYERQAFFGIPVPDRGTEAPIPHGNVYSQETIDRAKRDLFRDGAYTGPPRDERDKERVVLCPACQSGDTKPVLAVEEQIQCNACGFTFHVKSGH